MQGTLTSRAMKSRVDGFLKQKSDRSAFVWAERNQRGGHIVFFGSYAKQQPNVVNIQKNKNVLYTLRSP